MGTNRRLQSPKAMGSADLGMTLGPSPGYHVTLGKLSRLWALAASPSSSFHAVSTTLSRNHSRQGCNAPTLFLPDSSLSYPGRLASTWPPLNQSKPGQTSSKRLLSFLASETLPPDPAKESAAAARPGDPVSLGSGVSLLLRAQSDTLYLLGPWWVSSLNMGIPYTD